MSAPPRRAEGELDLIAAAVGAPAFIRAWLDRFYDAGDAELILAARASGDCDGVAPDALDRAVRRAVLDRDEAGAYAPASFHDRLEYWAMFEGWMDVPADVHRSLADWDVAFYAERIRPGLEAVRRGAAPADPADEQGGYTYVLLDEGEAILAAQEHIYLWPCDCRAIIGNCRKMSSACLRFDNDRDVGWEISRERAVEILRKTDKAGLMHTADYRGDPTAAGAICNCCTDCCYPHLATELLETGDDLAGPPARRRRRRRRLQALRPLRPSLPLRRHHGGLGRAAAAGACGLPRLRPLLHYLPHRSDRDAPARRCGLSSPALAAQIPAIAASTRATTSPGRAGASWLASSSRAFRRAISVTSWPPVSSQRSAWSTSTASVSSETSIAASSRRSRAMNSATRTTAASDPERPKSM